MGEARNKSQSLPRRISGSQETRAKARPDANRGGKRQEARAKRQETRIKLS